MNNASDSRGGMEEISEQKIIPAGKESLPMYEAPRVITFSEDELLAKLGPAQACSPFGGAVLGC